MDHIDLDQQFVVATRPSERYPIYTRANVAENWPGPVTTLSYTTMGGPLLEKAWRDALVRFGAFDADEFDPGNREMIGVFWGYPYLNLSVQRVFGVRMPGADPDVMDAAFFGARDDVPPYEDDPRDPSPAHTERIMETIGWALSVERLPEIDGYKEEAAQARANRPDVTKLSNRELYEYAKPFFIDRFLAVLTDHMFIIQAGSVPIGMVQSIAAQLGDPGLATRAMSGFGEVDSAAPTWAMWDLSRLVVRSPALTAEFEAGVDGGLFDRIRRRAEDGGDADAQAFVEGFERFLYDYGSRCSNEYEISELTWENRPTVPLTFIDRMRLQDESSSPQAGFERLQADREQVTADMLERLGDDEAARQQLAAGLKAASVFLPARERAKSALIRLLGEARTAFQELGRRMVEEGHFEDIGDITYLAQDEIEPFIEDPASLAGEVAHRKRWIAALAELEPPFITVGMPPPPSQWRRRTVEDLPPAEVGDVLKGIGVCPGAATGTARVILDPADGGQLEPGDVLVAPGTDPMWTPLFISAVAVVVDVGATLSHAAIVSRELGIPCVVNATNASRRIPNGATVTVDGTTGTVTVDAI